jgi:hypothetical protein
MQPKLREFLTQLRETAFLEIKPGYIDTGAAPNKSTAWADPGELRAETVKKNEVVAAKQRHKKLLWAMPVPGTSTGETTSSSSVK